VKKHAKCQSMFKTPVLSSDRPDLVTACLDTLTAAAPLPKCPVGSQQASAMSHQHYRQTHILPKLVADVNTIITQHLLNGESYQLVLSFLPLPVL